MSQPWKAWWRFRHHENGDMTCIVRTDHPKDRTDFVAEFPSTESGQRQAERFIADLESGRTSLMKLIK